MSGPQLSNCLPVKTVHDERPLVVNTPEESQVGEVVLEGLKIYRVSIQVSEDPALLFGHEPWRGNDSRFSNDKLKDA